LNTKIVAIGYVIFLGVVLLAGCGQNMQLNGRIKPYEVNAYVQGRPVDRQLPPGTVSRDNQLEDEGFATGKVNGALLTTFPITVTRQVLARGQVRYTTYCVPCHGRLGDGQGLIPPFGFARKPPSFHSDRLRAAPAGHFFDVITNGSGIMYSYASRVEAADRWAVIAYIRALQLDQQAPLGVPPEQIQQTGGSVK
jgi:mono/diheme cytochrome c family protein